MSQVLPDSQEFWPNKRVVVTGGAGFLGSFGARLSMIDVRRTPFFSFYLIHDRIYLFT